jgi:hypothetical protein
MKNKRKDMVVVTVWLHKDEVATLNTLLRKTILDKEDLAQIGDIFAFANMNNNLELK